MSNILADGTVMPHYFVPIDTSYGGYTGQFDNYPLRAGEVIDVVYPSDPRSNSKKFVEYVVAVQQRDSAGIMGIVKYSHCLKASLFGGVADKLTYTLRLPKDNSGSGLSNGSKVLVLCINGETGFAIIIGGMQDFELDSVEANKGHNLYFEFNGANATVNKDGEITVTFKGATNPDGSPADGVDTGSTGTNFAMLKDGTFRIKSKGVMVGDATDAWMLGTTYRNAESQSNKAVLQQLNIAMAQLTIASGMLQVPIVGPMTAAAPIQLAATALQAAALAIQVFEAQASTFLSKKNKTD